MDKTAIIIIDMHGTYDRIDYWKQKFKSKISNYISPRVLKNLNIRKINTIGPGLCSFIGDKQSKNLITNIWLKKGKQLEKTKTIDELARYIQRKLKEIDDGYQDMKSCKKKEKELADIINARSYENDNDHNAFVKYTNSCNRTRYRINKLDAGKNNNSIVNKVYGYTIEEREDRIANDNYYGESVTALIRPNNSANFQEIKGFTKDIEIKNGEWRDFSLEDLLQLLKLMKVNNIVIVDFTCNSIQPSLLDSFGITDEFISEQKTKKNNTIKSCNCKEFSFFGGGKKTLKRRQKKNKTLRVKK